MAWLNNYTVKGSTNLLWPVISPYSIRHFAALGDNISGWSKSAHLVVGFLEAIPILGQAASGCEWLAHYFFNRTVTVDQSKKSSKLTGLAEATLHGTDSKDKITAQITLANENQV